MFDSKIKSLQQRLNVNTDIDLKAFDNLLAFYQDNEAKFKDRPAFTSVGRTITYKELGIYSDAFAYYIQNYTDLLPGDKIAVQLPNIIQQPVVILGAIKAGLVVVNTNPLYTERELIHQFNDAEAKGLVVLANVADKVSTILDQTKVKTVIVTELADLHSFVKRNLVNFVVKKIKKMVPDFSIPSAIAFTEVMAKGAAGKPTLHQATLDDVAVLQYTGGTTGVAKGAMLTHANLLANALQSSVYFDTYGMTDNGEIVVQPLPLYHIFAFIVGLICMKRGVHTILIPNPRDLPALLKDMGKYQINGFCGLNTLFVALCNHPKFKELDFSGLKMTLSGGMALTSDAAKQWHEITGCEIYEGYGLTETSPVIAVNSGHGNLIGSVGVVVPFTEVDIRDDNGQSVGENERGELCVRGPQLMKGYWQREEATNEAIQNGWFLTGDIAVMTEEGYLKIVDRKKDMIIVSGFNVFPNEVEEVATSHPDILEAAAIGEVDDQSGEVVHLYVVPAADKKLTEADVINHCKNLLTGYKVPKKVHFRSILPKSNVGKILRRLVKTESE